MATLEEMRKFGQFALGFHDDAGINRHHCSRVTPLEVLHLAHSRTGTLSLCRAYEILGYPNPYHFSSVWANAKDCDMWMEAFRSKFDGIGHFGRDEWDKLLGHCGAVTDQPAILFAEELLEAYPDAKVVLVEREVESWYKSIEALFDTSLDPAFLFFRFLDPLWIGRIIEVGVVSFGYAFGQAKSPTVRGLKRRARAGYREHYANVRSLVAKERLLEYKLGSGWEPLCKFLNKPVPKEPFPHLNESRDLKAMFERFAMKAIQRSVLNVSVTVLLVGSAILSFRYIRDKISTACPDSPHV